MAKGTRHRTRGCLPANPRDLRGSFVEQDAVPHRGFFVPAFSVRRPLVPDDAAREFVGDLGDFCRRKPYEPKEIGKMGIMLLDRSRFEGIFRRADVQPDATDMLDLAHNVRASLGNHLRSRPRRLHVPIGTVAVFGNNDNKIAVVPEGWKGYSAAYARRDDAGRYIANAALTREINGIVGEIGQFVEGGINGDGEYVEVSTRPLERQTPHLTIATKTRGGSITNSERVDLAGQVATFMPPELRFYDPIIHLNLVTPGNKTQHYPSNTDLVAVDSMGIFVRTPQTADLDQIGYTKAAPGLFVPTA